MEILIVVKPNFIAIIGMISKNLTMQVVCEMMQHCEITR